MRIGNKYFYVSGTHLLVLKPKVLMAVGNESDIRSCKGCFFLGGPLDLTCSAVTEEIEGCIDNSCIYFEVTPSLFVREYLEYLSI